jgi:pimeloyl-ACP methyl ester carboxylesterase
VLVHGWQADRSVWNDVVAELESSTRTHAVDLRGSGAASASPGPYNLERYAADLRELIESLEFGPVIVVGHSMGATVALRLAVDAPEVVGGLVLIAPIPASGAGFSPKGEAYLRATAGDSVAARAWLARTLSDGCDPALLERLCAAAAKTPRNVALESFESWAHADFADKTKAIVVPTVVVAPENDQPEVSKLRVAGLIPGARHFVLPGASHYAIVEQPAAVARVIESFPT